METTEGTECLAYFASPLEPAQEELCRRDRPLAGAELVDISEISSADWQRAYRDRSTPFAVGRNWWVDPREPDQRYCEATVSRQLLQIPARTAFGTGSHASTALVVELMEEIECAGKRVLDVGTGTGILAMVALASGAKSVIALDIDPVAAFVAWETCRLNGLEPAIFAGGLASIRNLRPGARFDLILANVLPARLRQDLPKLAPCIEPGGLLLLSGLLHEHEAAVSTEMAGMGWQPTIRVGRDEWLALCLECRQS